MYWMLLVVCNRSEVEVIRIQTWQFARDGLGTAVLLPVMLTPLFAAGVVMVVVESPILPRSDNFVVDKRRSSGR